MTANATTTEQPDRERATISSATALDQLQTNRHEEVADLATDAARAEAIEWLKRQLAWEVRLNRYVGAAHRTPFSIGVLGHTISAQSR